jgi:hypothetical protein
MNALNWTVNLKDIHNMCFLDMRTWGRWPKLHLTGLKLPLLSQLKATSYNVWTSNVSNNIHAVSQIEEQRRRMKYNEENNPNLLFMLFTYICFQFNLRCFLVESKLFVTSISFLMLPSFYFSPTTSTFHEKTQISERSIY